MVLHPRPILESKGMSASFQKKGQKMLKERQKRTKYLKIWAIMCEIRKYFEIFRLSHAINC